MTWIILVIIAIITMVAVSLIFASSTYSPMPGVPEDQKVLRKDKLLTPEHDEKATEEFQNKHVEVKKLVPSANTSYCDKDNLEAASDALWQAVQCYEAIREDANSAVVELNLAILTKARIKIELKRNASNDLIKKLEDYVDTALSRADWLLKQKDNRYEPEVKACRKKLVKYNDRRRGHNAAGGR